MQPLLFEAGAALFDCQGFEYSIAFLLFYVSRLGAPDLSQSRTISILDHEEKLTAGGLLRLLKKHAKPSQDLEDILIEGLKARNILIHRYFMENIERLPTQEGSDALIREVRLLRSKVQKAEKALDPFIKGLASAIDGIHIQELQDQALTKFFGTPSAT